MGVLQPTEEEEAGNRHSVEVEVEEVPMVAGEGMPAEEGNLLGEEVVVEAAVEGEPSR